MLSSKDLLHSWKEISAYVGVTARTLQRWEKHFDFPVHRPSGRLRSAVVTSHTEIQAWLITRPRGASLPHTPNLEKVHSYRQDDDGVDSTGLKKLQEILRKTSKLRQTMKHLLKQQQESQQITRSLVSSMHDKIRTKQRRKMLPSENTS
jgi:hypothetical protein